MAKVGDLVAIDTLPGVQPLTDSTAVSTKHFTFSDKIREQDGHMLKIGGWQSVAFDYDKQIEGTSRSVYTEFINGKYYTIIGTNEKLYAVVGTQLINITPLKSTSAAAANSLTTHYGTLASNPLAATNGSNFVTVSDTTASRLQVGDTVTLSGATTFAGIPAPDLAGDFIVRSIGVNVYTIYVATAATSTASGGGASVVRSSGLLNLSSAAHGNSDGDRVKISGAADTGGILAANINKEFVIRNTLVNSFDFMTSSVATSSVSAAGGASTVYYEEIPIGLVNETNAQGYGAGLYGVGLYGTALISQSARAYPRIWFISRYADTIIVSPGNQGAVYQWMGSTDVAPALISGAPDEVNYQFISDNILVTLGAEGTENRVFASDQNDITQWTSSSTNQVFDDDIEGASRFISHCPVEDYNLLFTEFRTYKMRYIGLPFIWEIKPLDDNIGLVAPMARVPVLGMAIWMGPQNFYLYRGGVVEIIPANSQKQSTCLNYVFNDINIGQKSKFFAWYNKQYNEVWFHYASANSNEPNRVARVNLLSFTWTVDTFDRTAAEWPNVKLVNPLLINVGTLYKHEIGRNADGAPMPWSLTTNRRWYGKNTVNQLMIVPDSIQSSNVTFNAKSYNYPQSTVAMYNQDYTIAPSTEYVPVTLNGRFYEYTWSGNTIDQEWEMGTWFEGPLSGATSP